VQPRAPSMRAAAVVAGLAGRGAWPGPRNQAPTLARCSWLRDLHVRSGRAFGFAGIWLMRRTDVGVRLAI
jgi:hypothetical protein